MPTSAPVPNGALPSPPPSVPYRSKLARAMNAERQMALNAYAFRRELYRKLFDSKRDIDDECGYPRNVSVEKLQWWYDHNGMAARIVDLLPDESWAVLPSIYDSIESTETTWETEINLLATKWNLFELCHRIDKLSGCGEYGILLLGINDGKKLSEPVEGVDDTGVVKPGATKKDLLFIRPVPQTLAKIAEYEKNHSSPRFGLPTKYRVTFADVTVPLATASGSEPAGQSELVHWTRVIHIADNRETSSVLGTPRLRKVLDYILDLKKVLGGGAEMFWKGGFPGISFEMDPEYAMDLDDDRKQEMRDEVEDYQNGLQRYLFNSGVKANSLNPQVADPRGHIEGIFQVISSVLKCPVRVLLGSEEAKLASSQDMQTWNKRLDHRRQIYISPLILRPVIDRLMMIGALSYTENYSIWWPDLNAPSEESVMKTAGMAAQALFTYSGGNADTIIPPKEFLMMFFKLSPEEADKVCDAAKDHVQEVLDQREELGLDPNGDPVPPEPIQEGKGGKKNDGGRPTS